MAENDVNVTFGAQIADLTKAIDQVKGQLGSLNGYVGQVAGWFSQLNNVAALVAGTLVTLGLESFTRQMADSGIEAQKMSAMLGLGGKAMLELKAASAFSGVSMDTLATSIERLYLRMQQTTRDALSPQAQAFKALGLNVQELMKLPANEFFVKIAEAADKFNPSIKLTTTLMEAGGRGAAQLAASFGGGATSMKEFQEKLAATKIGLDGWKQAAVETHHNLELLDSATSSLSKQIFTILAPTINILIERMASFTKSVQESIRDGGVWRQVVDAVAAGLKGIVTALIGIADAMQRVSIMTQLSFYAMKGLFTDTSKQVKDLNKQLVDLTVNTGKEMVEVWKQTAAQRVAAGHDALKKEIEDVNFQAREQLNMRIAQIESEIKLVEIAFQRKQLIYERDVQQLTMTEAQKTRATIVASDERYALELAALQKELSLAGLMPAQKAQIEARITEMKAQQVNERLKLENQYVRDVQQQWSFLESSLSTSFSTALRGLLAGTTTWKNAMKSIFADVVTAAINEFLRLAVIKPIIQALSSAFAPADFLANILKVIMKLVGQVFTGATAFFAPTLGPAAPAAGAAVAAATEAAAVSYDVGSWSVPQTAHALVHKDEMILPVDFASAVRSALAGGAFGGASNLTVSIQAWDAAGVARWLRSGGADMLARAVSAQYNQNPTIRPRY